MMNNAEVITLETDRGEVEYKRLSARLPEFYKQFPPAEYSIESELLDAFSVMPGIIQMAKSALAGGIGLKDAGLPMPPSDHMLCKTSLLDKDGRVIATAHAYALIAGYKDLEILETASLQRLLARLGYGGETLNRDEDVDAARTVAKGSSKHKSPAVTPQEEPQATAGPAPENENKPATNSDSSEDTAGARGDIPHSLVLQIEHQAKRKNVPVPEYKTAEEARKVYKDLLRSR